MVMVDGYPNPTQIHQVVISYKTGSKMVKFKERIHKRVDIETHKVGN